MDPEYFEECGYNWSKTIQHIEGSQVWTISTAAILIPVVPISLVCNTLLLVVLVRTGHIRKRSSFLATNLALIDLFCTVFIGFSELYYVFWHHHFLGKIGCKITASAYTLYFSGTTLLMVFSSLERYYHAMLMHEPMKKWKMKVLLCILYLYLTLLVVLTVIGSEFEDGVCLYEVYFFGFLKRLTKLFHIITGFAIPGIVLGVIFYKVRRFLEEDARRYSAPGHKKKGKHSTAGDKNAPSEDGLRRNTTTNNPSGALSSRNRIFYILALSVASFYACELLYVIMSCWKLIAETTLLCIFPAEKQFVHVLSILAYPILIVNCAINPNIYLVLSKKFRKELEVMAKGVSDKCCCRIGQREENQTANQRQALALNENHARRTAARETNCIYRKVETVPKNHNLRSQIATHTSRA